MELKLKISRKTSLGLVVLAVALALVPFQNCSQTNFAASDESSQGAQGSPNDPNGGSGDSSGTIDQTISQIQPALAVRSPNCINCHGNTMASNLVTDFGNGDNFFFAKNNASPSSGDWIYGLRIDSDIAHGIYQPYWAQAQQYGPGTQIIVPQANLGFQYATYAPAGAPTQSWMTASTIKGLLDAINSLPGAEVVPVVEKSQVYIGAPSPAQVRTAGRLSASAMQTYYPTTSSSPAFSGLVNNGSYWTNTSAVTCDGDVFIDGTVFLNTLTLNTLTGCRIHATGPIFVQKGITYNDSGTGKANLELLSARLISMGVGNSHCETNGVGWYAQNPQYPSPIKMRLQAMADPADPSFKDVRTRNTNASSSGDKIAATPLDEGKALVAIAQGIAGLDDASCHGRNVSFSRLMLVAPQVHSRYNGNLTGVIITEFPLLSLGALSFTFDPIFQQVKVFPRIPAAQVLIVK